MSLPMGRPSVGRISDHRSPVPYSRVEETPDRAPKEVEGPRHRRYLPGGMPKNSAQAADRAAMHRILPPELFSGLLAIAADAVIAVDDELRIIFFNEGAERIFGWAASEVGGRIPRGAASREIPRSASRPRARLR